MITPWDALRAATLSELSASELERFAPVADDAARVRYWSSQDPELAARPEVELVLAALRLPLSDHGLERLVWRRCAHAPLVAPLILDHPELSPSRAVSYATSNTALWLDPWYGEHLRWQETVARSSCIPAQVALQLVAAFPDRDSARSLVWWDLTEPFLSLSPSERTLALEIARVFWADVEPAPRGEYHTTESFSSGARAACALASGDGSVRPESGSGSLA